jgi:hypothetical protein
MKGSVAAAAVLVAAWALAPMAPACAQTPGKKQDDKKTQEEEEERKKRETQTRQQFGEIVRELRVNAERWIAGQEIVPFTEVALKRFTYTRFATGLLKDYLRSAKVETKELYVANRLLRQLAFGHREAVRAALPEVRALHSKARKTYQRLPELTDSQIKALKQPTSNTDNARQALAERRATKVEKEEAIAKHNLMVYTLERRAFQLMLLAQKIEEDEALTQGLIEAEKERAASFLTILDGFASDARKMSKERAEKIYADLRPFALELKMEKKRSYYNRGKIDIRDDDVSTYERTQVYPGVTVLRAMNRIATAARMPAMKVPTEKQIVKYHKDREKRRQPAKRDKKR